MKLFVLLLVVRLSLSVLAHKAHDHDALRAKEIPLEAHTLSGAPLVEYLKRNQELFEVDPNPDERYKRMVMNLEYSKQPRRAKLRGNSENDNGGDIPVYFDGRLQWGQMCPSLNYIRDQSKCGACWAVASAEVMSDRLCISTNGAIKAEMSAEDIMTCCTQCGNGCDGGHPLYAFAYFTIKGTVTGGNYGSQDCCRPYQFPPCGDHTGEFCKAGYKGTPPCKRQCQPGYDKTYEEDKLYGINGYSVGTTVADIQSEIMQRGSVAAVYTVYQDFYHYKSGIYKHTAGNATGSHAVKIIGWGQDGDTPYWIIANSWGDWGEHGFFRMVRGINDCGIEESVTAVVVGNGQKNQ